MTRRRTRWWSYVLPTLPQHLLRRPEGHQLVEMLSEWWIAEEGLGDGRWLQVDHSRLSAQGRYHRSAFYARLDAVDYPHLPDPDEHAVDKVFAAFVAWATSRKARKLVERLGRELDPGAAADIVQAEIRRRPRPDASPADASVFDHVDADVHAQVQQHVSHQVHHHVHQQVHAHVHHAVSHAAAHGAGGGHAGGHGGGHH